MTVAPVLSCDPATGGSACTVTFTTSGSWTAPPGVTNVSINLARAFGGGEGGSETSVSIGPTPILVGGGAGGGAGPEYGGGGGGGGGSDFIAGALSGGGTFSAAESSTNTGNGYVKFAYFVASPPATTTTTNTAATTTTVASLAAPPRRVFPDFSQPRLLTPASTTSSPWRQAQALCGSEG